MSSFGRRCRIGRRRLSLPAVLILFGFLPGLPPVLSPGFHRFLPEPPPVFPRAPTGSLPEPPPVLSPGPHRFSPRVPVGFRARHPSPRPASGPSCCHASGLHAAWFRITPSPTLFFRLQAVVRPDAACFRCGSGRWRPDCARLSVKEGEMMRAIRLKFVSLLPI